MSSNRRRLMRDVAELGREVGDGIEVLEVVDMGNIKVLLTAPEDSDYATGKFEVTITVDTSDYPMAPPLFNFTTKIYHPNISYVDGEVCVDRLKENWSPSIILRAACEVVQWLLREPYPKSPLNVLAARMMRRDPEMFTNTAQMWTKEFAKGTRFDPSYEVKLTIVRAVMPSSNAFSRVIALMELTDNSWDVQTTCDSLGA